MFKLQRPFLAIALLSLAGATSACGSSQPGDDIAAKPGLPGEELGPPYNFEGFELPGADFFPEGITVTREGSFFVGSLTGGSIFRLRAGERQPEVFVPGGDVGQRALAKAVGMIADEGLGVLWVCDAGADTIVTTALVGISLDDGHVVARHPFPDKQGLCNDATLDDQGNLYASDSVGHIVRVAATNKLINESAAVWASDSAWMVGEGEFGLNGLDAADGNIYVAHTQKNAVSRIPISLVPERDPAALP